MMNLHCRMVEACISKYYKLDILMRSMSASVMVFRGHHVLAEIGTSWLLWARKQ